MITVTTVRDLIREVSARWDRQYPANDSLGPKNKHSISRGLAALDKEKATAKDVEAIVGNGSWTNLDYDSCGANHLPVIVTVGEKPGIETATANLCYSCCMEAWSMMVRTVQGLLDTEKTV